MNTTPRHAVAGLAIVGLVLAVAGYYAHTHELGPLLRDFMAGRPVSWPPPPKRSGGAGGSVSPAVVRAAIAALLAAAVVAAACVISRLRHRRARAAAVATFELQLGRDDLAEPWGVQEAFEGIAGALSARWYRRLWTGQEHLALEVERQRGGAIRFLLRATHDALPAIAGQLDDLYPDVTVREVPDRSAELAHVVRLKKRRSAVLSIQTTRDYRHSPIEALVSLLGTSGDHGVVVQLVLTPAPGFVHARHRRILKRRERRLNADDRRDRDASGVGSVVEAKELEGALETQHRSLLYFDLRIAGTDAGTVRRAAGSYQTTRSENELVPREMRVRRSLYAGRVGAGTANPLPSLHTGLISTSELATLWHLPRARAKHANISRATVRRAAAPPEIERDHDRRVLVDEHGPVSIGRSDRKYGHALMGGQGGGKSSVMARHFHADARDYNRALFCFDPKGPLAELCLGLVPPDRVVHYLDLGAPQFGINPLAIDASPETRADLFVRALIEANPPGAIQAASDSFLRQATTAVCTVEAEPTLLHVYALLGHTKNNTDYRDHVVAALNSMKGTDFLHNYWIDEFPALIDDKGFAAQALNPPRNKLQRILGTKPVDIALRHDVLVDLAGIVERNEILIVNGAKADVGEDNAILMMQILLQLTHRTLQRRQHLPDGSPPGPVSLLVDEAHNILTASTARMLAEGRSAGLEAVFAWQYSAQIVDEVVRSGVRSLLQSISLFRMREMEDARSIAGLAMQVYSDKISVDRDEQERLRLAPDDIVKLPVHRAINLWVADGIPRAGFLAQTLPMEQLVSDDVASHHRQAQLDRGCHDLDYLSGSVELTAGTGAEAEPAGDSSDDPAPPAAPEPTPPPDETVAEPPDDVRPEPARIEPPEQPAVAPVAPPTGSVRAEVADAPHTSLDERALEEDESGQFAFPVEARDDTYAL